MHPSFDRQGIQATWVCKSNPNKSMTWIDHVFSLRISKQWKRVNTLDHRLHRSRGCVTISDRWHSVTETSLFIFN